MVPLSQSSTMWSLRDLSDTKLLFRCLQAVHHRGQLQNTPHGLLRMQSKLDSFIKVACPHPSFTNKMKELNASWAKFQTTAMQAHYAQLQTASTDEVKRRQITSDSFEKAWSGALKWAHNSLGRKLAPQTTEAVRNLCCQSASSKAAPAPGQAPIGSSIHPPHSSQSLTRTNSAPVATPGDWELVEMRRQPAKALTTRAVSGHRDPLSNFYPFNFYYNGVLHRSVEHAYQMLKAKHFGHRRAFDAIRVAPDAYQAKSTANSYFKSVFFRQKCRQDTSLARLVESWDRRKEALSEQLVRAKAQQCPAFTASLRESGTRGLLHNVRDPWWGTGTTDPQAHGGRNVFGRVLERLRHERFGLTTAREDKAGRKEITRSLPSLSNRFAALDSLDRPRVNQPEPGPSRKEVIRTPNPVRTPKAAGTQLKPIAAKCPSVATTENRSVRSDLSAIVELDAHSNVRANPEGGAIVDSATIPALGGIGKDAGSQCATPGKRGRDQSSPSNSPELQKKPRTDADSSLEVISDTEELLLPSPSCSSDRNRDTSALQPENRPGVHLDTLLNQSEFPALPCSRLGSPSSSSDSTPSPPPSPSYSECLSPSRVSSPLTRSSSTPNLASKPTRAKVMLNSTFSEHDYTKANVEVLRPLLGMKTSWQLPPITKPVLVIGDSNLGRIVKIRKCHSKNVQIVSYPGCKFGNLLSIFQKERTSFPTVQHVIFSVGINDRQAKAIPGVKMDIRNLHRNAVRLFPNSKLHWVKITNPLRNPQEKQSLKEFEAVWRSLSKVRVLSSVSMLELEVDGIHWKPDTANRQLEFWLSTHLNFQP